MLAAFPQDIAPVPGALISAAADGRRVLTVCIDLAFLVPRRGEVE